MLSRRLVGRGIISVCPASLARRSIPQNLHTQRHLIDKRAYSHDGGRSSSIPASGQAHTADKTTEQHSIDKPPKAKNAPVTLSPSKDLDDKAEKKRKKLEQLRKQYAETKAATMPCPPGVSAEDFAAMTIPERIKLREQKKASLKAVKKMLCPEGITPAEFAAMSAEDRLALLVHKGGQTRKKRVVLSPIEVAEALRVIKEKKQKEDEARVADMDCPEGVLAQDFASMPTEQKLALLPKPRKIRKDAGIKKASLLGGRKKMKTTRTKVIRYDTETLNALLEAGIHGNDLDFRKGGVFASADASRMNIISEDLCDDILERLGPSLEKHKGCDLIDINPGVGTWSTKLHSFLKPRTHIMMEPDKIYTAYLEKLTKDDPTYKMLPLSGIIWQNLLKLEEDNLLPHQTWRKLGDPELDKPNDTLLITLNLGYFPRRSYLGFASITHLVMHQLFTATRAHSIFQAYGQIRMLVWVHDYEKRVIVPRTLSMRTKSSIEAETCSEYVHEVCGADGSTELNQRGRDLNLISARRVRKKMQEAGMVTPAHRKSSLELDSEDREVSRSSDRVWHEDLVALQKALAAKKYPIYSHPTRGTVYVEDPKSLEGPGTLRLPLGVQNYLSKQYVMWSVLKHRHKSEASQEEKSQQDALQYEELEREWVAVTKSDLPEEEKNAKLAEISKQVDDWYERIEEQNELRRRRVLSAINERRGVTLESPLLEWDRRAYEPLLTKKEDFWPKEEMALLDIKPKTLWPSLTNNALADYDYYEMLISNLTVNPAQSIVERLRNFAPGADEWIIPRCPSLRDVEKGGAIKLDLLTVRSMTTEMLREVFEAFMKWPFRPQKGRMLQALGSTSVHEEDMEDNHGGMHGW